DCPDRRLDWVGCHAVSVQAGGFTAVSPRFQVPGRAPLAAQVCCLSSRRGLLPVRSCRSATAGATCANGSPPPPRTPPTEVMNATAVRRREAAADTPVFFIRDGIKFQNFIPLAEAPGGDQPARQRHAVGLLDGLARVCSDGHLADG